MEQKGKILVVDDNEDILFALNLLLKPLVEDVRVTKNPEQIDRLYDLLQPDVVLLDMNFRRDAISGEEGFEWLEHILHHDAQAVVILMTAYADTDKAVRAMKSGATDFITKPWNNSKLLATLFAGIELSRERRKRRLLEQRMEVVASPFGAIAAPVIIGESPVMQRVLQTVAQVASTDANVLILGENGTGKDVIARQIAALSARASNPFVSIDLGSVPELLFESELFGYEKGAFTDARKAKAGRMETANGGTLFLDEIGNLPLSLQAKLEITIPPLRERGEDIILLAEHFLTVYAHKYNKKVATLNRDARQRLLRHTWPGNVRELMHTIERAVLLAKGTVLCAQDFVLNDSARRTSQTQTLNLERLEQEAIERAMQIAGGNVTRAAELLGITRFALYRKLSK